MPRHVVTGDTQGKIREQIKSDKRGKIGSRKKQGSLRGEPLVVFSQNGRYLAPEWSRENKIDNTNSTRPKHLRKSKQITASQWQRRNVATTMQNQFGCQPRFKREKKGSISFVLRLILVALCGFLRKASISAQVWHERFFDG